MTRTLIPDADWLEKALSAEKSIFRLEQQPVYASDLDPKWWPDYEAWLRCQPRPIDDDDAIWGEWTQRTRKLAAEGRPLTRIRVIDDPPTNYQQWTIWTATHINNPNGEQISYIDRATAQQLGLRDIGPEDWWLLDGDRLLVMHFGDRGEQLYVELVTAESQVAAASRWANKAVVRSSSPGRSAART